MFFVKTFQCSKKNEVSSFLEIAQRNWNGIYRNYILLFLSQKFSLAKCFSLIFSCRCKSAGQPSVYLRPFPISARRKYSSQANVSGCQRVTIKETFCSPSHPIIAPRKRASPCKLLSFSSRREGFVRTPLSELLTRGQSSPRSVTALYCLTWSGEIIHQTAGALERVPPGPWGGHYDRDERLESTGRRTVEWQQGRTGHNVREK